MYILRNSLKTKSTRFIKTSWRDDKYFFVREWFMKGKTQVLKHQIWFELLDLNSQNWARLDEIEMNSGLFLFFWLISSLLSIFDQLVKTIFESVIF